MARGLNHNPNQKSTVPKLPSWIPAGRLDRITFIIPAITTLFTVEPSGDINRLAVSRINIHDRSATKPLIIAEELFYLSAISVPDRNGIRLYSASPAHGQKHLGHQLNGEK
jgi:hypothetical protein